MCYLAAGVMFPLTLIVAVCSWIYAPLYQSRVDTEKSEDRSSREVLTAQWRTLTAPRWITLVCVAGFCSLAMWRLGNAGRGWEELSRAGATLLALTCAMVFDARTHLIPNLLVGMMLLTGAAVETAVFFLDRTAFLSYLLAAAVGLVICFAVFFLLSRLTKNGLGMGDVKLLSAMGWLTNLSTVLWSTLFTLLLCLLPVLFLMLTKKKGKSDHIPFGPFVFLGYVLLLMISGG